MQFDIIIFMHAYMHFCSNSKTQVGIYAHISFHKNHPFKTDFFLYSRHRLLCGSVAGSVYKDRSNTTPVCPPPPPPTSTVPTCPRLYTSPTPLRKTSKTNSGENSKKERAFIATLLDAICIFFLLISRNVRN